MRDANQRQPAEPSLACPVVDLVNGRRTDTGNANATEKAHSGPSAGFLPQPRLCVWGGGRLSIRPFRRSCAILAALTRSAFEGGSLQPLKEGDRRKVFRNRMRAKRGRSIAACYACYNRKKQAATCLKNAPGSKLPAKSPRAGRRASRSAPCERGRGRCTA